jgi:hypothetical protein
VADPSIKDLAYRALASVVGTPVDLATMAMRPFGYRTPDEQVVGSSEYIGRQMERAGLVSSARAPIQEFLASMAVPTPGGMAKGGAMLAGMAAVPRASKAENIARGLYHPIGEGKKLEKPVSEMQFTQEVVKDLPPRQIISPERLAGCNHLAGHW